MKRIENGQEVTFLEQVDCVLLKNMDEHQKHLDVKKLFLLSDKPLVSSVVRGDTTFSEMFRPLMQEYDKLRPTSLLTDTCMNEEFMKKGEELKEKVSGVIHLGLNMIAEGGCDIRYCDITLPFSRSALAKKAYETNRVSVNIFMVSLLFYLLSLIYLDTSDIFVVGFLDFLSDFLFLYFIIVATMFLFCFYRNYFNEYALRKSACLFICLQVDKLDNIAHHIFFGSK